MNPAPLGDIQMELAQQPVTGPLVGGTRMVGVGRPLAAAVTREMGGHRAMVAVLVNFRRRLLRVLVLTAPLVNSLPVLVAQRV